MRKADLFDEIIMCLRESAAKEPTAEIAPDTLFKLNGAVEKNPARPAVEVRAVQNTAIPAPARNFPAAAAKPAASASLPANADWETLYQTAMSCQNCALCSTRTNVVFADGNPRAELMFIGEGPGENEDLQGVPFVGRAGELLTRMIAAMGFDRKTEVYIANIVKCRPPDNRNPEPSEAAACLPYLERQIELVKPRVIVLLGAVPLLYLLNMRGITRIHGNWFEYKGIKTIATFHPAYLLRSPDKKGLVWQDLQVVMREFGKTPPVPKKRA